MLIKLFGTSGVTIPARMVTGPASGLTAAAAAVPCMMQRSQEVVSKLEQTLQPKGFDIVTPLALDWCD
jgi:hypothetical protein